MSREVMGAAEVGELLGVSRTRVMQLMRRPDFPQPITKLVAGFIWDGAEVRAWLARNRPDRVEPEENA